MGKTQIALELAYRTKEKYGDCSVFWIPATNTKRLKLAFTDIGQQLRVPGVENKEADVKKLVQRHLSQDSAGQWLLIVDNVDDMDMWNNELKGYLPMNQQGRIVCTTRSRKIAVKIAAANVIEVREMDEDTAMQLLSKLLINQHLLTHGQEARKLIKQLTFLPLAIVQAAAYINENGTTLSSYLSLLEEQEQDVIDLLSEGFEDDVKVDGRYEDVKNSVATTWLVSFEQIQRIDPLAAEYLSFMSCVAPKDIPQSLLPPGPSRKKEIEAIGTLDAYSFVNRRVADNVLDMHRLVHLAMRNWLRTRGQWHVWATRALERLMEVVPFGDRNTRDIWTAYLPHAMHVVKTPEVYATENRISLLNRIGHCQQTLGQYQVAEWAYRKVFTRREKVLGREHSWTITSMSNLAGALSNQGKYAEAEKVHRDTLALSEKVFGKEALETLTIISNLALALGDQGKYTEAEHMHKDTLALVKGGLGEDHPCTLARISNLAQALSCQGKYAEAEEMQRETLALKEKVFGKEHPSTLVSMGNLAAALSGQGKYEEAEKLHRETLALHEKVLGKEHPDTLSSVYWLAHLLHHQHQHEDAILFYERAYTGYHVTLGSDHPTTRACSRNYTSALHLLKTKVPVTQTQEFADSSSERTHSSCQDSKAVELPLRLRINGSGD